MVANTADGELDAMAAFNRVDVNPTGAVPEPSTLALLTAGLFGLGAMRIAEIVQSIDDLGGRERLTAPELVRPGKDTWIGPLRFTRKAGVDHPGEPEIEIDADDRQDAEDAASADEETKSPFSKLRNSA